jgi:pantetheine-phosphate adenylyltransferase
MMPETARAERVALYPGTFDPVHNGHLDIIGRAARLVDRLVIGVAMNIGKNPFFSIDERVDLLRGECVEFARQMGAGMIVRGLRAVSDFDYEFQMAGMNARLDTEVETVFLPASERQHCISSRFVKEIAALGGDISTFVPERTLAHVLARVRQS